MLAIPVHAHSHQKIRNIKELDHSILDQIESFFLSYTKVQGKKFKIKGCSRPREAVKLVRRAMQAFKKEAE